MCKWHFHIAIRNKCLVYLLNTLFSTFHSLYICVYLFQHILITIYSIYILVYLLNTFTDHNQVEKRGKRIIHCLGLDLGSLAQKGRSDTIHVKSMKKAPSWTPPWISCTEGQTYWTARGQTDRQTYRQTLKCHVDHYYVGLAQACHNNNVLQNN